MLLDMRHLPFVVCRLLRLSLYVVRCLYFGVCLLCMFVVVRCIVFVACLLLCLLVKRC